MCGRLEQYDTFCLNEAFSGDSEAEGANITLVTVTLFLAVASDVGH